MTFLSKPFLLMALSMTLTANTTLAASANYQSCQADTQLEGKLSKKKKLKTFTADFWRVVESQVSNFPPALKEKGVVVGDFHFANLGIYFDSSSDRARLTLNDLDDSGHNYLVGDLLKYLLFLKSLKTQLDLSAVVQAYSNGLKRSSLETPGEIRKLLNMKSFDFQKESAKFAAKKRLEAEKFNFSSVSSEDKKTFEDLEKLSIFRNLTSVQKWLQVNTSGSSMGLSRYNFVATSSNTGVDGVLEFKELTCAAAGDRSKQDLKTDYQKTVQYLNELYQVNEKNSFLSRQTVLSVNGKYLLLREKFPNLFKDLEIETFKGAKLQKYSEFFAHYLGFIHSGSASRNYQEGIQESSWILGELKPLEKEFLSRLTNDE